MWQHQQLLLLPVPSQTVHVPSQTVHCLSFELLSKVRFEKNKELVPSQTAVHNHTWPRPEVCRERCGTHPPTNLGLSSFLVKSHTNSVTSAGIPFFFKPTYNGFTSEACTSKDRPHQGPPRRTPSPPRPHLLWHQELILSHKHFCALARLLQNLCKPPTTAIHKLYFFQTSRLDGTLGTSRLTIED